jgi:hypothetical protein
MKRAPLNVPGQVGLAVINSFERWFEALSYTGTTQTKLRSRICQLQSYFHVLDYDHTYLFDA